MNPMMARHFPHRCSSDVLFRGDHVLAPTALASVYSALGGGSSGRPIEDAWKLSCSTGKIPIQLGVDCM